MKFPPYVLTAMLAGATLAVSQTAPLVASHSPAKTSAPLRAVNALPVVAPKPAVRVNGAILTETDVVREMYAIFPYASQHNGFPKDLEPEIRKGATNMVIFEELLYQEAKRRKMVIPPEKVDRSFVQLKRQFADSQAYRQYLNTECKGSAEVLKGKIRRSMLIERMLTIEVEQKLGVTPAAAKAYYDTNARQFEHGETVSLQTISIIPPEGASPAAKQEAKAKITDIVRLGHETKTYRDFGLLAEQISEDDWRTKLGDHGVMEAKKLPTEILAAVSAMKVGEVSNAIHVDRAWVVIRLNAHTPGGKTPFAEAKSKLVSDLRKQKRSEIRATLNQKLSKGAKIEIL